MKAHGTVETYLHTFLTLTLSGGVWSASRPQRFTKQEKPPPVTVQYSAEVNIWRHASIYSYIFITSHVIKHKDTFE